MARLHSAEQLAGPERNAVGRSWCFSRSGFCRAVCDPRLPRVGGGSASESAHGLLVVGSSLASFVAGSRLTGPSRLCWLSSGVW